MVKNVKIIENVSASKRKRYNKNKKKAWRKKVQIQDVEELLEEKRREERYGGPLEERKDEEMLFLDVGEDSKGKDAVTQPVTYTIDTRRGHKEGYKTSRRRHPVKTLYSHRLLNGLQGAKTTHKEKTKKDKVNAVLNTKENQKEVLLKKPHLVKRSRKQVKQIIAARKPIVAKVSNKMEVNWTQDAWDDNCNEFVKDCQENGVDESFADGIVKYYSISTKKRPINVPTWRYKQTSALPAVAAPDPGQSYNPAFEDHQNLLQRAVQQQIKLRKEAGKYIGLTTKMYPTIDDAPTEETWMKEMSEGLPTTEAVEESESDEDDTGKEKEPTVTGKKTTERKTKKQRKKEKKQKWQKRRSEQMKEKRVRESNIFRIKTYKKEIKERNSLLKSRHLTRKANLELKMSRPRRLGKLKYQPEDIAVNLGSEVTGSLRTAKPAVSLLDERFKNYQRRNILEPRLKFKPKKTKPKVVMKRDHKEVLEEIEKTALKD
ncbi:Glioma tumor suppressor candidate region protein 2 [Halocaridina rubra]|uniref:Ribosome biogenesis protein NOP53 n=1 Tax=Halocaridina rubra TaxID=373956 RepID=A0AAN8WYK5_HALRR